MSAGSTMSQARTRDGPPPRAGEPQEMRIANAVREFILEPSFKAVRSWPTFDGQSIATLFNVENAKFLGAGVYGTVFKAQPKSGATREALCAVTNKCIRNDPECADVGLKEMDVGKVEKLKPGTDYIFKTEISMTLEGTLPTAEEPFPNGNDTESQLTMEYKILNEIQNNYGAEGMRGFTKLYGFGYFREEKKKQNNKFLLHYVIMEACEMDIEKLMQYTNQFGSTSSDNAAGHVHRNLADYELTPRTVCMIGEQLISRLRVLHSLGYVHYDLKDNQLMMGRGNMANVIYLVDFGLAMQSTNSESMVERGNMRMKSRTGHNNKPIHFLDDLESLCYVLLRLLKNNFPWDGRANELDLKKNKDKQNDKEKNDAMLSGIEFVRNMKDLYWKFSNSRSDTDCAGGNEFFNNRSDIFGDGGWTVCDVMQHMQQEYAEESPGDSYFKIATEFATIDYDALREILLGVFDLTMNLEIQEQEKKKLQSQEKDKSQFSQDEYDKLEKNLATCIRRTMEGKPVYHYFLPQPDGSGGNHVAWDWYWARREMLTMDHNHTEYYKRVLSNRKILRDSLRRQY